MKTKNLELVAAQLALGLVLPEELPRVAVDALEAGCDSPSLRVLAGLTMTEIGEARQLFDRVLGELQLRNASRQQAVVQLAKERAREILSGERSPYQGAKEIWQLSLRLHEVHLPELDSFIYYASEWENRPEDRYVFEAGIVDAARELLGFRSEVSGRCLASLRGSDAQKKRRQ